jgi:hypothetical protein
VFENAVLRRKFDLKGREVESVSWLWNLQPYRSEIGRGTITTGKWRNRNSIETSSIRTDIFVTRIMIVAKAKDILHITSQLKNKLVLSPVKSGQSCVTWVVRLWETTDFTCRSTEEVYDPAGCNAV